MPPLRSALAAHRSIEKDGAVPVPEQGTVPSGSPDDVRVPVCELGNGNVVDVGTKFRPLKGATRRIRESGVKPGGDSPPRFQSRRILSPVGVTIEVACKNVNAAVYPGLAAFVQKCLRLSSYARLSAWRGVYIPKPPQKILIPNSDAVHVVWHNLILLRWPATRQVKGYKRGEPSGPAPVMTYQRRSNEDMAHGNSCLKAMPNDVDLGLLRHKDSVLYYRFNGRN